MLCIRTLVLGAYQVNCYLTWEEASDTCAIIDPGYDARRILREAKDLGKTPEAILLTHGHFDHVGAVKEIWEETSCRVYLCRAEYALPEIMTAGPLFSTDALQEGDHVYAAGLRFQVLHTPGHTPGSVCLLAENTLFSGDTLFAGSRGRTDFPGSSTANMLSSLKRLSAIGEDLNILPGHGEATTLSREKQYNPFLQGDL